MEEMIKEFNCDRDGTNFGCLLSRVPKFMDPGSLDNPFIRNLLFLDISVTNSLVRFVALAKNHSCMASRYSASTTSNLQALLSLCKLYTRINFDASQWDSREYYIIVVYRQQTELVHGP